MSSILKALRKVEDENAAQGGGSVDLAHNILKRSYDEKKSFPWSLVAGCIVLMVTAVALGWWLAGYQQTVNSTSVAPAMVETSGTEQPLTGQGKDISIQEPVMPKITVAPIAPVTVETEVRIESNEQKRPQVEVVTENIKAITFPAMLIEEIVYQQDPAARLAVINGLPVMEGTDIDGVHVVEILPDRIRCSYQGKDFLKFKGE